MVVTNRATAGERIAKPEIAVKRDSVCGVGECGRSLVCSNNEIGIVAVVDNHIAWMDNPVVDDVVRNRQQSPDEDFVRLSSFRKPGIAVNAHVRQTLGIESAFCARRHDNRVLDALRLHQAKDFRTEVVTPVRPAQATARHRSSAQVNAFHARRIDKYLTPRQRRRQAGDLCAIQFEGQSLCCSRRKCVGAYRG